MVLILREVLEHQVLASSAPELLSGETQLEHPVRWVHTADLYDIAPLLRGDEVLLTNGVGLVSVDEQARRHYVRALAARSVAGLFFEIGRGFAEVPAEMVEEARRLRLALVVLQPVLRFTEVAEALNSEIIDRSVVRLRHADEISRRLSEALAEGATVADIVGLIATATGAAVTLRDSAGTVVTTAGTTPDGEAEPAEVAEVPILIEGTAWGRLTIGPAAGPAQLTQAALDRAPRVIELCLIREQHGVTAALRGKQVLLEQLAQGQPLPTTVLEDGLRGAGLPTAGHDYVCLVVVQVPPAEAARAVDLAGARCGPTLYGFLDGVLYALITAPHATAGQTLSSRVAELVRERLPDRATPCASVGEPVSEPGGLPENVADTRAALELATALRRPGPVVRARSTAVTRLLARAGQREALRRFDREVLGPLDTGREELLTTLREYVRNRGSISATARRLHLKRQSLYYRIEKISRLLDLDLADPEDWELVTVALATRRTLELVERDLIRPALR